MALVKRMEKISRNSKLHDVEEASYNVVHSRGDVYIQINTYGSKERKTKGEVSQTIQLSVEAINQLKEIILNES
ncbi:MAG: hypothetical protein K0S34_1328 [Bacillales bacterium]|jgi:uncharacterized pyridoxal phosphate-containing UPF0001 family protein|nr:hypothetical protein [Bacillales bacterium]